LNEYKQTISNYQELIKKASDDEVSDIVTNLLACAANQEESISAIEQLANGLTFDKTYEYFFNLS
jgi:hypothetical protein